MCLTPQAPSEWPPVLARTLLRLRRPDKSPGHVSELARLELLLHVPTRASPAGSWNRTTCYLRGSIRLPLQAKVARAHKTLAASCRDISAAVRPRLWAPGGTGLQLPFESLLKAIATQSQPRHCPGDGRQIFDAQRGDVRQLHHVPTLMSSTQQPLDRTSPSQAARNDGDMLPSLCSRPEALTTTSLPHITSRLAAAAPTCDDWPSVPGLMSMLCLTSSI